MERYAQIAALPNATGSLLHELVENALQPASVGELKSVRTMPISERPAEFDHAAICRVSGEQPALFGVAMSSQTAQALTSLVLGEMSEVTEKHTANVVSESSQWIASRALPSLGVCEFDVRPENVAAETLSDWFPPETHSVWLLLEFGLGTLLAGVRAGNE